MRRDPQNVARYTRFKKKKKTTKKKKKKTSFLSLEMAAKNNIL